MGWRQEAGAKSQELRVGSRRWAAGLGLAGGAWPARGDTSQGSGERPGSLVREDTNQGGHKKAGCFGHPAVYLTLLADLFYRSYQQLEGFRLVHRQVGQYLTVQGNSLYSQLVDEYGVGQPFFANGGVDTGDPQCAVFPFLQFAAYITVLQTFFQYVFGNGIYILTLAIKALGLL